MHMVIVRTLELAFASFLNGRLDLVVRCALLNATGQVHHGNILSWYAHGHASELAVERWNDLANCLCGSSTARDDILSGGTTTSPILARRAVNCLLRSGV